MVVFKHGHERTADGQAGAVERVNVLDLAVLVLDASAHAASLECFAIRTGRNFAVHVLRRQPHFQVKGLGSAKAHVARAKRNNAVRQAELLQNAFGIGHHFVQVLVAFFRTNNANHFHLVELMLADHAARVATVGTGFRAEARRMSRNLDRQLVGTQELAANHVGQGHFSGRDQVHLFPVAFLSALFRSKKVFFKLRQLTRAAHRFSRHHIGGVAFDVAVFTGVRIQHELRQSAVQASDLAAHKAKARARLFGCGFKVHAQRSSDIDMILDGEIKLARRAPTTDLRIVALIASHGDRLMRQVGHAHHELFQVVADIGKLVLQFGKLFGNCRRFGH